MLNSELKDAIYCINYSLMSILILYDYSFDRLVLNESFSLLKKTLELVINDYFVFCEYIIKKVSKKNSNNKWIKKLNNLLSKNEKYSKTNSNINYNDFMINNISSIEKLIYNTNTIIQNLNIILQQYKSSSNESLLILFKKISQKSYEDINYYYRTFLLREENINGSFLVTLYLKDHPNFYTVANPYITKPNNKKYSLVLDLEETLINFRLKTDEKGEGILKFRPGLYEFLEGVAGIYEIILFTSSSQDYAESLINAIEENKKYFEYTFFRQHNIIIENDFVKDISRIGRNLDKIIIVDNMPQNFRLQKDNGIMIKAFWGEDYYDTALNNLIPILTNIAKEEEDVRKGLEKYKDEILKKVSLNITNENTI
jgi:Dullard-like phosphatase family protein